MKEENQKKKKQRRHSQSDNFSMGKVTNKIKKESMEEVDDNVALDKVKSPNHEILRITYIFVGLFVLLLGYLVSFMVIDSDEVINNSYNKRQDLLATRVVRGEIQGSKGETLAKTVEEDGNSTRIYPYEEMFSHIVGRFSKGKTGIESNENFNLLTSHDNPIKMLYNEMAGEKNIGDNIVTTLDVNLQKTAYNALGDRKGAIVVLEPSTGKILAMVSKPDYDPNQIDENWGKLTADSDKNSALINRGTQGLYPPGSTFKILTVLEYIRENPDDYKDYLYHCEGKEIFNSVLINCYNNEKHGEIDLMESFAESCNTSFANMGTQLNMDSFRKLSETFLFNKKLPTNIPHNQSSFVVSSASDKSEIPQTVIGQGKTQISPLHNALITSAIANGGILMNPYVVDHIESHTGNMVKKIVPSTYGTLLTSKEAEIMTNIMESVVSYGTGSSLNGLPFKSAGKTGSAEFGTGEDSHAWYVGFAPTDKPQIVVSIIVEGAGTGSSHAVPIAKELFVEYLNRK